MKAMLVYQAGIANVFEVASFNLADYGRDARRIYQGDFRTAENIARGMGIAGAIIRTAACNQAGDIAHATWSDDLESQPFSDQFHPVNAGSRVNEEGRYDSKLAFNALLNRERGRKDGE